MIYYWLAAYPGKMEPFTYKTISKYVHVLVQIPYGSGTSQARGKAMWAAVMSTYVVKTWSDKK